MDWIALVNDAVRDLSDLEPRDRMVLRQLLTRRLRRRFDFPLETDFSAVVKGDRRLRWPGPYRPSSTGGTTNAAERTGDDPDEGDAGVPFLELVPGELTPDAYEVLGGVLVGPGSGADGADDLGLASGSIVEATIELEDPDRYLIEPPAMMGRLEALEVKVRVGA